MKPALEALVGRRSFFKKAGMAAAGASALSFATQDDAEAALGQVNTSSKPSDLKITDIRVRYTLKVSPRREEDARWAFGHYIEKCPAAQSVTGCINIAHELNIEAG